MAFDFPNTPALDDVYAPAGGPQYKWNGFAWLKVPAEIPTGGSSILISDTPPADPTPGTMWWESDSGNLFIFVDDGNSAQWVQATIANMSLPPSDGNEYAMVNGLWRLKSQTFNLEGLLTYEFNVPATAKMARFSGQYGLSVNGSPQQMVMRASLDGATFLAGAADYYYVGMSHYSGASGYQHITPAGSAYMYLVISMHDYRDWIANFDHLLQLERTINVNSYWVMSGRCSSFYQSAASNAYAESLWRTMIQAPTIGSPLVRLQKLRVSMINVVAFGPQSRLVVDWMY